MFLPRLKKWMTPRWIAIGAWLLLWALYLPGLSTLPMVAMDEPAYAATAWQFLQGHGFYNPLWVGSGQQFFLFPLILAFVYKLLGVSLWSSRLVSVAMAFVSGWMILKISRLWVWRLSTTLIVLGVFFLNNASYVIFRSCRPESVVATCLLIGLWLGSKILLGHRSWQVGFGLGVALIAAVLAHPIGVFFLLFFLGWLCLEGYRYRSCGPCLGFLLGVGVGVAGWALVYMGLDVHSWSEIIQVLKGRTATQVSRGALAQSNVLSLYHGYSLGLKRLFCWISEGAILGIGFYYACFNRTRGKATAFLGLVSLCAWGYFAGLVVGMSHLVLRYYSLIPILASLGLGILLDLFSKESSRLCALKKRVLIVWAVVYCGYSAAGQIWVGYTRWPVTSYSQLENTLAKTIPEQAEVITFLHLWFPFYRHSVVADTNIGFQTDLDKNLQSGKVYYVVLSDYLLEKKSPTTGMVSASESDHWAFFYTALMSYIHRYGQLQSTLSTHGYGTIRVWKLVFNKKCV